MRPVTTSACSISRSVQASQVGEGTESASVAASTASQMPAAANRALAAFIAARRAVPMCATFGGRDSSAT